MTATTLTLHSYQEECKDFLRAARGGRALFLDMGLGKTAATLSALEERHLPALVIAPKRVTEKVWPKETPKWRPDLTYAPAVGTKNEREAALLSGADIVFLSRDNFGDVTRLMEEDKLPVFKTLILDELSSFKNRTTLRWKTAKKFLEREKESRVKHVWGLTGTPVPNGLIDLWPQIALLDRGKRLGRNITTYRNRFFYPPRLLPSGVAVDWELRPGAAEEIYESISDICLAMETEGRIELPPVTYNDVELELPPAMKKLYRTMANDLIVDMEVVGLEGTALAQTAAVVTNKLSQISAGFLYTEEGPSRWLHDTKIDALEEVIEGAGGPVLVFYRYQMEEKRILEKIKGARSIKEKNVLDAWDTGDVPVMVAHPAAAGHGLNLQEGGHTIVWTTGTWSLEEWLQSNKRLARQGQKHPVVIHSLIAAPVDRMIKASVSDKNAVQLSLLDWLESPI